MPEQHVPDRGLQSEAEQAAMLRARDLAATPGVQLGPNPRVGCVLLDQAGRTIAEGFHRGAGTPHAEAAALTVALAVDAAAARGSTAVVTLEPCDHTGRTGPCTQALIAAGVRRVVFAQRDPNPVAAGGAETLRTAGIEVVAAGGPSAREVREVNRAWTHGVRSGRPLVTWKLAASLDGRSAALDGTSRWITGSAARRDVHRLRAACDTVLVGTGTVVADDPALTVRDEQGDPTPHQPLRAVMGERTPDPSARVVDDTAETVLLRTRDPHAALTELFERGRRHVFLEGGPTLAAAFLGAGLVDEIVAYVAPVLLGSGAPAVGDLGISTIDEALRLRMTDAYVVPAAAGEQSDVRLTMVPDHRGPEPGNPDEHQGTDQSDLQER